MLRMAGPTVDPAASRETADVLLSAPQLGAPQLGPGHSAADGRHPSGPSSIELWHRRTCGDPLGVLDLLEMIDLVVAAVLPRHRWTAHPVAHPGTLRGRRIDVVPVGAESAVRPVGIGGGGLVRPEILDGAALPPGTTGLALTLRLDRLANLTGPRNDSSGTPTD